MNMNMTNKIYIGYPQADSASISEKIKSAGFSYPVKLAIENKTVQPVILPSVRSDIPSSLAQTPYVEVVFKSEDLLIQSATDLEQIATIRLREQREGVAFEIGVLEKTEAKVEKPAEKPQRKSADQG